MSQPELSLSRAQRRAAEKLSRRAPTKQRHTAHSNSARLATMPWRIDAVWYPVESFLDRILREGTVDELHGKVAAHDDTTQRWYEFIPAVRGLLEFHRIAAQRHGWNMDLEPLSQLITKLANGSLIFAKDVLSAQNSIGPLKQMAGQLTLGEAVDINTTVNIKIKLQNKDS